MPPSKLRTGRLAVLVHVVAIVLRLLDRHLRLCGRDDAIVVLGMLQIVLRT